jgi:Flp pilus assembly protein TadG
MALTTKLRRRRKGERGSELIEFALVFPMLLMVVLAIVDFGFLFQRYEVVTNAAREGARVAVLPGYTTSDIQDRVTSYATAGGLPTAPTVSIAATTITAGSSTWPATTVNVSYSHQYLFLGGIASWFGGSFSSVTLTAASTMRNELGP